MHPLCPLEIKKTFLKHGKTSLTIVAHEWLVPLCLTVAGSGVVAGEVGALLHGTAAWPCRVIFE
jgi:hypothetical protein